MGKGVEGILRIIASYRNAVLIYNPFAGKLSGRHHWLVDKILESLRAEGIPASARATTGPNTAGALAAAAIADGADLILAAGGDGTINEVANGMIGAAVPLAILPAGTANVLAMELGFGRGIRKTIRRLRECVPERIAVGRFTASAGPSRHFLLMAGAGLDAYIVAAVSSRVKAALGKVAYWIAGFSQLGKRFQEFEVRVNGKAHRCSFALVSRVRNYGGDLEIARGASLLEPRFEVVLFSGSNSFRYLPYLFGVITGRLKNRNGVIIVSAENLEIVDAGAWSVLAQIDGETAGRVPARVEIVPDALTILTPPEFRRRMGAETRRVREGLPALQAE
ncbi:MAG: diacylglycerol kinase family lipid kinase [Bryobacteraceae bacterium]|nr:diacylglycerol kinase family lipid kinase [Bryobacteraceae bacterium]